jgi:hypothetical protein
VRCVALQLRSRPMKILEYVGLDTSRVGAQYKKVL